MRKRIGFFLLVVLAAAANLFVANAAAQAAGKFRVSGRVVNALSGQAIAGAEISVGLADRFDATMQKILTGNDGEFAFTVSETGKYMLLGETNGFRRQSYEQHGAYNSAVVVGEHVSSENILFRLRPDGRILGTIVDEGQDAVQGAMIYLFRTDASGGGIRQTYRVEQTVSDDRGCYRFAHLEPGRYYVVVSAQPWYASLGDAESSGGKTMPEVTYATTFYPGVTDVGEASPIAVNDGEDVTADFRLSEVPALRLRLSHFNKDQDKPRGASLERRVFGTNINEMGGHRQTLVENSLDIHGVAAGRYVLEIESYDGSRTKRAMVVNVTGDSELDPDRAAVVPAITGVVKMDGGLDPQQQAFVLLWNAQESLTSAINEKGEISFEADYLAPGTYSVAAVVNGFNSTIARLSAAGARVMGQSIQIVGGKPVQLEIVLSRTLSKINGIARKDGKALPGAMILLVPENPEVNLSLFRRDQSDSDGTYTLRDVLPGRYRMLALADAWDMEWANLAALKGRLEKAQTIEVVADKTYDSVIEVQ